MVKKNKQRYTGLIIMILLFASVNLVAQITIGSAEEPLEGSLLDLKEEGKTTKGLLLPRVQLVNLTKLQMGDREIKDVDGEYAKHTGLVAFNVAKDEESEASRICPGLHVWDGIKWVSITPYPVWDNESMHVGHRIIGFYLLDHNSPVLWPEGYKPIDYPLGVVGTVTDNRPGNATKTYTATRYYASRHDRHETYYTRESFSCDPNNPDYKTHYVDWDLITVFDDGVWLSENISATVMPDGTPIAQLAATTSLTEPQFAYPNKGTTSPGQQGLLYNFAAATNKGREGVNTDQGGEDPQEGIKEGIEIQGICPEGWLLPSDREWTDLENGIRLNTLRFSSTPNIGGALIGYNGPTFREPHGRPMKSTTPIASKATGGTSKLSTAGGLNILLTGHIVESAEPREYGTNGMMWTSSVRNNDYAYARLFVGSSDPTSVLRNDFKKKELYSVRCKRALEKK